MMDTGSKTSDRDTSQLSELPSDLEDSSESDSTSQPTEWLATTRQRRSTAGNRMKSMLANEEPDSDLELLFAEDENDQGFSDVDDDGSDAQMDSSSDDEDDKNANADELEGEKELENQAKAKRAAQRKRKAQEVVPAKFRKKVRIYPTTTASPAPAPRPKKKSERASWLPSAADLPTRASSRKTTRISKEQLHQQMAEREAKRLRQLAQAEKKAARLEAMKKPPMTQEDRLKEAASVEKRNSKSLNRWEEAEKQREEERKAKLAALNQRTLKGPVITFWSGRGQWDDVELRALRPFVTEVEEKPKKKREKSDKAASRAKTKNKEVLDGDKMDGEKVALGSKGDAVPSSEKGRVSETADTAPAAGQIQDPISMGDAAKTADPSSQSDGANTIQQDALRSTAESEAPAEKSYSDSISVTPVHPAPTVEEREDSGPVTKVPESHVTTDAPAVTAPPPIPTPSGLAAPSSHSSSTRNGNPEDPTAGKPSNPTPTSSGVLAAPLLMPPPETEANQATLAEASKSNVLVPPSRIESPLVAFPSSSLSHAAPPTQSPSDTPRGAAPLPMDVDPSADTAPPQPRPHPEQAAAPTTKGESPRVDSEAPGAATPGVPLDANATRNGIIFQNFNDVVLRDKSIQTQILFGRKMTKLASKTNPPPLLQSLSSISFSFVSQSH